MKKLLTIVCVFLCFGVILTGCGKEGTPSPAAVEQGQEPTENTDNKEIALEPAENTSNEDNEEKEAAEAFGDFTATDLEGNEVTQDIFADAELTMVNIWGTFCGPCLREMPDIGEIAGEYADKGLQIIGIVIDVYNSDGTVSDSQIATAKEIVEKTKADYQHVIPSLDMMYNQLAAIYSIPETLFINKDGEIVGAYTGAKTKDKWIEIIDGILNADNGN